MTARTRRHAGDQGESSWEDDGAGEAQDGRPALIEGLPEIEDRVEMAVGKVVEEEHAGVGKTGFTRTRREAATRHSDAGDPGMGASKRALRREARQRAFCHQRLDLGGLDGLLATHRRQKAGKAPRQCCLAGARRSDEKHVVAAGGGDLEATLGGLLAPDL
jgi:hypothetical protein